MIAVATVGAFLGGTAYRWSQGVMLILISLVVLARPPGRSPGRAVLVILIALVGLMLMGFAPAHWGPEAKWRDQVASFEILLPNTVSLQPWLSFEGLMLFGAAALWICWLQAQDWSPTVRADLIRKFGVAVVFFAAIALVFYFAKWNPPFWTAPRGIGPFPNRNHTSNFLALGGIVALACAHDRWRHGRATWAFWVAGWAVILAALIINWSRAGIILLLGGAAVWLGLAAWFSGSRSTQRLAIGTSVFIILLSLFVLFGGSTLDRFKEDLDPEQGLLGFRALIFRDTLQMIGDSPWLGVGLTNFWRAFPFYREASVLEATIVHPESDWLWLCAELGWPGAILMFAGFLLLLRRGLPFRNHTERHLRAAAWVGAIAFAVHGFVDVAGHRLATVLPGLLLLSIAAAPASRGRSVKELGAPTIATAGGSRWIAWGFRVAALPFLSVGALWIWASWTHFHLPGAIGVAHAKLQASDLNAEGRFEQTIQDVSDALRWAPLDWQLYMQRGAARAYAKDWVGALGDFRRARRLEPALTEIPLAEGRVWLRVRPMLALSAWQDALQRASPSTAPKLYAGMLALAPSDARFRASLRAMSDGRLPLQLIYLSRANPEEARELIGAIRQSDPELEALSAEQKAALFAAWARSGGRAELIALLQQNAAWMSIGWRHLARDYATQNEFRQACEIAFAHLPIPPVPKTARSRDSLPELRARTLRNPGDFASAYALYLAELNDGRSEDALAALIRTDSQANRPAYFAYLTGKLRASRGEWSEAWMALAPLLGT